MIALVRPTRNIYFIWICCLLFPAFGQAQLINTEFGQNRLQYEHKDWYHYQSEHFDIYYAQEDEALSRYLLPTLELDYAELTRLFEHQLKKKIQVMLYSDYSDYIQSNIGITKYHVNEGGETKIRIPKVQVYFTGSHENLRKQVRQGLAETLLGKVLMGTSIQEIVQNSVLLNLPPWFLKGAVAHVAEGWTTEKDDQLRDVLLSGKYANFSEFAKKEPQLAGQSLFHYISQEYSASTISNLLYLTRINRSIDNGFLYVFNKTYYQVVGTDWFNYYRDRYNNDNGKRRFPNKGKLALHLPKKATVKHLKISPNSKYVAYVEQDRGTQKVIVQEVETSTKTVLFKTGMRDLTENHEQHYPLIAWSPTSDNLIIIYEKNNKVYQRRQGLEKRRGKDKRIVGIERIINIAVWDNTTLFATAINAGRSDIYQIKGGNAKALTNDLWDEMDIAVLNLEGQKGLVFSSNRADAGLRQDALEEQLLTTNMDLYFYAPSTGQGELLRLTRTPAANEKNPIAMGKGGQLTYLSDENGFYNRYVARVDSVLLYQELVLVLQDGTKLLGHPDSSYTHLPVDSQYTRSVYVRSGIAQANTDYSRNILAHDANHNKVADLIYNQGKYHVFVRDARPDRVMEEVQKTAYRLVIEKEKGLRKGAKSTVAIKTTPATKPTTTFSNNLPQVLEIDTIGVDSVPVDTGVLDIDNYEFKSGFKDVEEPTEEEPLPVVLVEEGTDIKAKPRKKRKNQANFEPKTKMVTWDNADAAPYKSLFKIRELTFQLDNTPLYNGMDLYLGNYYQFQPLSFAFKMGFVDIFNNFYLEAGIRLPLDFNGMEYLVNLYNRRGRIDQKYSFYRRGRVNDYVLVDTLSNKPIEARGRAIKHWLEAEFSYPLDKFQSLRTRVGMQLDRIAILADDVPSLSVPIYTESRLNVRFEYVFDNAVPLYINAWKGTKFKAYVDIYKPFRVQNLDGKWQLNTEGGLTTAIGFDARKYWSFDNKTVVALRAAGATSFGQQKILYSLGGVENWMFPANNNTITLPKADNYGLQTLASGLRGFANNSRNGSSYVLINAELRVPIVGYLFKRSPRNTILRNLQLIGFLDIGTAWQGTSPFSADNPLNTTIIDNNRPGVVSPVRLVVNYYRRPILVGYGLGIRTILLDHYFRLDYAWGVETGQVQKPMVYFSVGKDF